MSTTSDAVACFCSFEAVSDCPDEFARRMSGGRNSSSSLWSASLIPGPGVTLRVLMSYADGQLFERAGMSRSQDVICHGFSFFWFLLPIWIVALCACRYHDLHSTLSSPGYTIDYEIRWRWCCSIASGCFFSACFTSWNGFALSMFIIYLWVFMTMTWYTMIIMIVSWNSMLARFGFAEAVRWVRVEFGDEAWWPCRIGVVTPYHTEWPEGIKMFIKEISKDWMVIAKILKQISNCTLTGSTCPVCIDRLWALQLGEVHACCNCPCLGDSDGDGLLVCSQEPIYAT